MQQGTMIMVPCAEFDKLKNTLFSLLLESMVRPA